MVVVVFIFIIFFFYIRCFVFFGIFPHFLFCFFQLSIETEKSKSFGYLFYILFYVVLHCRGVMNE